MKEIDVEILRDISKTPSRVTIVKDNRKLEINFEENKLTFKGDGSLMPSVADIVQMSYPFEFPYLARPQWYDRNPTSKAGMYFATKTDGASPLEKVLEYTCPPDRKAMVEVITMCGTRMVVGAAPNVFGVFAYFTPVNDVKKIFLADLKYGNTTGDTVKADIGASIMMNSDDYFDLNIHDLTGAGSSIKFSLGYKLTEFDR